MKKLEKQTLSMEVPIEVSVDLPHESLKEANWADAFEYVSPVAYENSRAAAEKSLTNFPFWIETLLALRDFFARKIGLKTRDVFTTPSGKQLDLVGFFPVCEETNERIILGFNDWHLDFRLIIEQVKLQDNKVKIKATTLVKSHNIYGKAYLSLISPFHKMIVPRVLKQAL
ncbi:DUF2867 domain-containing protein [Hyphomicrobiales bacterium 4NK60-0047b]